MRDPDQVVPVVLYTVLTLILHASFNKRTSLSLSIPPVRETILYFVVYSPAATILLFFLSVSLRFRFEIYKQLNFVGESRSYHSTLFFPLEFILLLYLFKFINVLLYLLTA